VVMCAMDNEDDLAANEPERLSLFDRLSTKAWGWVFGGIAGAQIGGLPGGVVGAAAPELLSAAGRKVLSM